MYLRVPDLLVPPVANPTMDEIRFWLRIMMEHSLFMQLGFPCTEANLIRQANEFQKNFQSLLKESETVPPSQFMAFVERAKILTENLRKFKRRVLHIIITCGFKLGGYNHPLLIDHISREAEYFILVLEKAQKGKSEYPFHSIIQENVFWLRIMGDHAKFIHSLLDQSERGLQHTVKAFSDEYDLLLAQARDLEGYLWDFQKIPALIRFQGEVKATTTRYRDFKAQAAELVDKCAILSLIPAPLADHVRREAEHFLMILETIEGELAH
ncbi:MAG: DUF2935 domain-containing protein [Heliobacteriaceae bacterium]|nr:DUF2935 domain-containing protein [Heliobacteriaceae bacterium]